jgi:electron transport complex protein RnfE
LTSEALMPADSIAGDRRLTPLLGLAPLAVAASTLGLGLTLGLTVLLIHCGLTLLVWVSGGHRAGALLPAVLLVLAGLVTAAQLLCKAFLFDVYVTAGGFFPLLIANGALLAGTIGADRPQSAWIALGDALRAGVECALLLCALGGLRELIGTGFTLALAPAGALLVLAMLAVVRAAIQR